MLRIVLSHALIGIAKNIPTEKSKLKPLSLYAKSKVKINFFVEEKNKKSLLYSRFATAFGLSIE